MTLRDLGDFFDPDLHLPIRGKNYTVPAPDFEEAQRLRAIVLDQTVPASAHDQEAEKVLGPAFAQMVEDDLPWPVIVHATRTTMLHFGLSPDVAEVHWSMAQLGSVVDLERVTEALVAKKKGARHAERR